MKINWRDRKKIEEVLAEVEKGCSARTVSYEKMIAGILEFESKVAEWIPDRALKGVKVKISGDVQRYKKYSSTGTELVLQKGAKDWFLISAERGYMDNYMMTPVSYGDEFDTFEVALFDRKRRNFSSDSISAYKNWRVDKFIKENEPVLSE